MTTPTIPAYMRREQAAQYLHVSDRTLSIWQRRRLVPFIKVSHRVVLFRPADLDKAMSKMLVKSVE